MAAGALWAALAGGCGGAQKHDTQPAQPLEERRAVQVIADAVRDDGATPTAARPIAVGASRSVTIDVGIEGHRYGVAFTNQAEREALGSALPPRSSPDELQLVLGTGADDGTRVVVLHDADYLYDDHLGTDYDSSTITAERKLARDVHDFLVKAQQAQWP